jgi:hypothetical protein
MLLLSAVVLFIVNPSGSRFALLGLLFILLRDGGSSTRGLSKISFIALSAPSCSFLVCPVIACGTINT